MRTLHNLKNYFIFEVLIKKKQQHLCKCWKAHSATFVVLHRKYKIQNHSTKLIIYGRIICNLDGRVRSQPSDQSTSVSPKSKVKENQKAYLHVAPVIIFFSNRNRRDDESECYQFENYNGKKTLHQSSLHKLEESGGIKLRFHCRYFSTGLKLEFVS